MEIDLPRDPPARTRRAVGHPLPYKPGSSKALLGLIALSLTLATVSSTAAPLGPEGRSPPEKTSPTTAAAALTEATFVTDEWHNLTRRDGTGLYFELVSAVFARRGIKTHFRIYPYARSVQMVRDEKADGWIASFMDEKSFPLYPKWHFDRNEQTVVYLARPGLAFNGTASLHGKRVAWLRDFGLDRYIKVPMRITEVDSIRSAFEMLKRNRIDYFVGARSDITDYISQSKQDMTGYEMRFAMYLGLYVAFAPTERGKTLRNIWDAEMQEFHQSEAFKAIYKKYGYPYPFP